MEDAEALARARAGETEAFRVLVERHGRTLYRLAYRLTGSPADAEDAVQETFLKAYSRMGQFAERAAVSTWLHRIATNAAYDILRARQRRELPLRRSEEDPDRADPPSEQPGPDRLAFASEVRDRLGRTVQRMTALERTSFVLRHLEGKSIRQIGDTLGQTDNSIKQSLLRAVGKLRTAFEGVMA